MKAIATFGYEKTKSVKAGALPVLQWLSISDLVIDPTYHRPIVGRGRRNVDRIARSFSWSCFATVIVAPVEGGKFAIIDGQHRTTAAALAGFKRVPCQIVAAAQEERAIAFKALNGSATAVSRMAFHAAGVVASDPWAVRLAEACVRAEVELLRYPVSVDRQSAGQTMAVGAIARCLKHYGEETLITALQCVTQTSNNKPGALSARTIKALCAVLGNDRTLRDSGLALLETFDGIDLEGLAKAAARDAAVKKVNAAQALADLIRSAVVRRSARNTAGDRSVKRMVEASRERRLAFVSRTKPSARTKALRPLEKS
jgi:hypothetical protein